MYEGQHSMLTYSHTMDQRAIPFMSFETVPSIRLPEFLHKGVPRHFRDDRGERDSGDVLIAAYEGLLFPFRRDGKAGIEEDFHARGRDIEPLDRNRRRFPRRVRDPYRIDDFRLHERTRVAKTPVRNNVGKKDVALLRGKLFRIAQFRLAALGYEREDCFPIEIRGIEDGSDAYGTGECTSPSLVHAD